MNNNLNERLEPLELFFSPQRSHVFQEKLYCTYSTSLVNLKF